MREMHTFAAMTHAELRQSFYQALSANYLQGELLSLYHWCAQEIEGWSKSKTYLMNDTHVSESSLLRWKEVIERLKENEPVQYIFNKAQFGDFELYVDHNVLIPRPETEDLVALLLAHESDGKMRVLDIGTGSGCIALAMKHARMEWEVSACDISASAIEVAQRNAKNLGLPVNLFQRDVLSDEAEFPEVDIYISNPPYIPTEAKSAMHSNVLNHEPHVALFAPEDDPLAFYKRIAHLAVKNAVKRVYFETHATDMDAFKDELSTIWKGTISVHNDISGKGRFVILG